MAWLKIDQNTPEHPKTIRLRALRRHKNTDETTGFMTRLWGWALDAKPDGMIGDLAPEAIAEALGVRDGAELLEHLRLAGFICTTRCLERGLDPVGHRPGRIHDWDEHSGELAQQRVREAERKRLTRAHDREQHPNNSVNDCPKCQRAQGTSRQWRDVSAGQKVDSHAERPANGSLPPGVPVPHLSMSAGQKPDTAPRPPDASRARAREGDKRERETRQDVPPSPRSVDRTPGQDARASDHVDCQRESCEHAWLVHASGFARGTWQGQADALGFHDCYACFKAGKICVAYLERAPVMAAVSEEPEIPDA